jgi:hypothetical protein
VTQPTLICVTPTRNESWIIRPFLAAARTWAQHVIVADQGSDDGTPAIIQSTPGATYVRNDSTAYDESHRQRLLLSAARKHPGRRIMIALDADEALSGNCTQTGDWQRILAADPGTVLRFRWANVLPGFRDVWLHPSHVPFGFVDDGSEHVGRTIHSPRLPLPANGPILDINDFVILHFQFVVWERMQSKQRWYQAWEHVKHRQKGALEIFRMYNHMHGGWKPEEITPAQPEWLALLEAKGIDFRSLACEPVTWWDRDIVRLLEEHGTAEFRRIALWDKDWNATARALGRPATRLDDPRRWFEKTAHRLLAASQGSRTSWPVRALERLLRLSGW